VATPVPLRGIERLGFVALLATVIAPLKAPVTVGLKDAVSVALAPAATVNGVLTDASENPVPEIETAETATGPVPVFVSITVNDEVVLTCTLPKFSLGGVAVSGPRIVPVPLSGMERFGSDALLLTDIEPLAAPDTVGANVTIRTLVAPTARVNGVDTEASENPDPEILTLETVSDAVPVFLSVTV